MYAVSTKQESDKTVMKNSGGKANLKYRAIRIYSADFYVQYFYFRWEPSTNGRNITFNTENKTDLAKHSKDVMS